MSGSLAHGERGDTHSPRVSTGEPHDTHTDQIRQQSLPSPQFTAAIADARAAAAVASPANPNPPPHSSPPAMIHDGRLALHLNAYEAFLGPPGVSSTLRAYVQYTVESKGSPSVATVLGERAGGKDTAKVVLSGRESNATQRSASGRHFWPSDPHCFTILDPCYHGRDATTVTLRLFTKNVIRGDELLGEATIGWSELANCFIGHAVDVAANVVGPPPSSAGGEGSAAAVAGGAPPTASSPSNESAATATVPPSADDVKGPLVYRVPDGEVHALRLLLRSTDKLDRIAADNKLSSSSSSAAANNNRKHRYKYAVFVRIALTPAEAVEPSPSSSSSPSSPLSSSAATAATVRESGGGPRARQHANGLLLARLSAEQQAALMALSPRFDKVLHVKSREKRSSGGDDGGGCGGAAGMAGEGDDEWCDAGEDEDGDGEGGEEAEGTSPSYSSYKPPSPPSAAMPRSGPSPLNARPATASHTECADISSAPSEVDNESMVSMMGDGSLQSILVEEAKAAAAPTSAATASIDLQKSRRRGGDDADADADAYNYDEDACSDAGDDDTGVLDKCLAFKGEVRRWHCVRFLTLLACGVIGLFSAAVMLQQFITNHYTKVGGWQWRVEQGNKFQWYPTNTNAGSRCIPLFDAAEAVVSAGQASSVVYNYNLQNATVALCTTIPTAEGMVAEMGRAAGSDKYTASSLYDVVGDRLGPQCGVGSVLWGEGAVWGDCWGDDCSGARAFSDAYGGYGLLWRYNVDPHRGFGACASTFTALPTDAAAPLPSCGSSHIYVFRYDHGNFIYWLSVAALIYAMSRLVLEAVGVFFYSRAATAAQKKEREEWERQNPVTAKGNAAAAGRVIVVDLSISPHSGAGHSRVPPSSGRVYYAPPAPQSSSSSSSYPPNRVVSHLQYHHLPPSPHHHHHHHHNNHFNGSVRPQQADEGRRKAEAPAPMPKGRGDCRRFYPPDNALYRFTFHGTIGSIYMMGVMVAHRTTRVPIVSDPHWAVQFVLLVADIVPTVVLPSYALAGCTLGSTDLRMLGLLILGLIKAVGTCLRKLYLFYESICRKRRNTVAAADLYTMPFLRER